MHWEGVSGVAESETTKYATQKRVRTRGNVLISSQPQSNRQFDCFLPGMMYVSERKADSIWDTELAFFKIKSSYTPSHLFGTAILLGSTGGRCIGASNLGRKIDSAACRSEVDELPFGEAGVASFDLGL